MTISARAEAAAATAVKSRRFGLLTSGTAVAALVAAGAGLVSPISVRYAAANDECGTAAAPVNPGDPQNVSCGNIVQANDGVTYDDANIADGSLFIIKFQSTQVNKGGVLLTTTTNNNGFDITIEDVDGSGGAPSPVIKNNIGGDAAVDVITSGTGSGIKLNMTSGSVDGNGGSRQGIQLTTNGTGSNVTLTTSAGTSSKGTTGIQIDTNGGSNIDATISGKATGTNGAGLSGDVDGGSGYAKMTVASGGNATGTSFGVVADTSGGGLASSTVAAGGSATATKATGTAASSTASNGGNATTTVNGTATATATALGVGGATGAASTTSGGGTATTIVGPQGKSEGSLFGASATAGGSGDAVVVIGSTDPGSAGTVKQTAATAGILPVIPAGAIATSSNGSATVTAHQGSTVTQVGSTSTVFGLFPEVKGIGLLSFSTGTGAANTTSNGTVNATGIGAAAIALQGDATTNVGGQINVGGGSGVSPLGVIGDLVGFDEFDLTVGAAAISGKSAATLNIQGGSIGSQSVAGVTPDIGGLAVVASGSKHATITAGEVDVNGDPLFKGSTVNANKFGLVAANLGSGNAVVVLEEPTSDGNKNVVNSGGSGIIAAALGGGDGNVFAKNSVVNSTDEGITAIGVNANVDAGDVNSKNASAILAFASKDANVNVYGEATGDGGILTPVTGGIVGGTYNLVVHEGAWVHSNSKSTSDVAVGIVAGDKISVVNDGTIDGTMILISENGNYVQNNSNNTWNWSGVNLLLTGGDNVFDNNGTSNATNSLNLFISGGDSIINNNDGGTFNANGLNAFVFVTGGDSEFNNAGDFNVNGVTGFFGLEDYNNSGTTNMQDDAPFDLVFTTGNFNGTGDSTLAIDAQLTPGGFADWLFIGGDLTGTTFVDVNDIDAGPGLYTGNDDAILFALVGGDTDSSNFTTNGGYDKGLFRYDVYLRDTPIEPLNILDWNEWVLASTLDREAFEFPVIAYGAQNLWYASTGTWLDRTADLRSAFGEVSSGIVDLKNEGAVATMPGSVTPGAWGRVFGGTLERDMENTANAPTGLQGPNPTFRDTFNQNYYGFMGGVDFGKEGVGANGQNTAWLFGIMGGYTASDLDFDGSDTNVDYQQGSIGAYVTYLNGGFFADAAVKADFGNFDYRTQFGGKDDADYTSIGVILDTGYRFNGASGWFIEPKATLAYVNTDFDDIDVLGTPVEFSDGDSLRGRLGVRVGASLARGDNVIEPYLEASLWNEFHGDYDAALISNGFNLPVSYDAGGLSGEVSAGANIINVGNGWNAFAKGSVQFGEDDLLGFSGNLGFRKNW